MTREQKILDLFNKGVKRKEIQKETKSTHQWVSKILKKHNLTRPKKIIDRQRVVELLKAGYSVKETAELANCHTSFVYAMIKQFGLKIKKVYSA